MLTDDGRGMLYVPFLNYADGNLDATREMLRDPNAVPGLSDGGAHCGIICDASFPTYLLTHWTRDRTRGEKLSIPFVVAAQSRKTALSVGLYDRGVIAPSFKADVNVIDYDKLHLHPRRCITTCRSAAWFDAAGRRLRRHHRLRRGDAARRQGHRRPSGQTGAWRAGYPAEVWRGGGLMHDWPNRRRSGTAKLGWIVVARGLVLEHRRKAWVHRLDGTDNDMPRLGVMHLLCGAGRTAKGDRKA